MKTIIKILLLFLPWGCNTIDGQKCIRVIDGDTIELSDGTIVRLAYLDCPEITQEYGEQAKNYTESLILNREIDVDIKGYDKYNRTIGNVYINRFYVNEQIIKKGMAWAYNGLSTNYLHSLQLMARRRHIGLWTNPAPIPPFKFREIN